MLDFLPVLSKFAVFSSKTCLVVALIFALRGTLWVVNMVFIQPLSDPLRHLPGPEGSLLQSQLQQVMDPALSVNTHVEWRKRFGETFRFNGFGKHDYRLLSFNYHVIHYIMNSPVYEKPWQTRSFLGRLIGRGIFSMEGTEHAMQRRIIAPAFKDFPIKNMAPVFSRKAEELHDRWKDILDGQPPQESPPTDPAIDHATSKSRGAVIDIAQWISRASFDVIGLTGFNYDFHSVEDESERVYTAYRQMFDIADKGLGLREILELYFPILRKIWVNNDIRTTNQSLKVIASAGKAIIDQRKAAVKNSEINHIEDKDLLTRLIKSNLSSDPSKRLTDRELLDQCSTFLLAGSDSVSVALSWCFHLLAMNPDIQTRLRNELCTMDQTSDADGNLSDASTDSGFHDCLSCNPRTLQGPYTCRCPPKTHWDTTANLPYLDGVVREALRLCPPVHGTIRVATEDDQIPVPHPITLSNGSTIGADNIGYISIRKGSYVHIPIEGLNFSEDVWGKDALEFNPDRWRGMKSSDPSKPGITQLMTFGCGPHFCLGHKFATAEMKVFIATLLPRFEFSPAANVKISKFNSILTRPFVSGKWSSGTQLPVMVRELK
ncbi:hypothetical protein GALMADRAFT_108155 [Galerina marginata CBS 339.88]|uniref:Cytochrome P450 n=1 Tax=Galerina marginata (strain CBS 339.88) TaxID=685588 RepID=A0A067TPV4_GALM3|nr:hypothetical protein GALMADRAFT_108155 [Galerina marginata CBS 339.88]